MEVEKVFSDKNEDYVEVNDKYDRLENLLEEREMLLKHS